MIMGDINMDNLDKCDSVSQANVHANQYIKEETVYDEFQIDIQEHSLENRGVDVKEVIDSPLNEVLTARKYNLQVQAKNEAEVDSGFRISSFKQEMVKCDPEETEVYGERTTINSGNQCETIRIGIKRELEDSDNPSGVEKIRNVRLNKTACITEYPLQAKSETGFDNIDKHNENESEEEIQHIYHQCNFCEFETKQKYTLKQHINHEHNNKNEKENSETYQCQFCKCKYRYKQDLKRHINHKHNENSEWHHCNSCFYKTKRKRVLMIHLERHKANREIYRCEFCEYKSKYKYELKKHINYKHSEGAQWYQCCFCDHKTKRKTCLVEHFKAKHDENPEMYHCHFCEFKSKVKTYLRRHIHRKHTENTERYCCQFCEGKFKTRTILRKHVKYIHNDDIKWYQCDYCKHKTKYIKHLANHVRAKHEKKTVKHRTENSSCQE